ncbi:MAG: hypothetical protein SOW64_00945, partial [Candidatus Enterosoma sp.]|nr:hypothetical protein [Candidatus Enterosoma sp.]
SIAKDGFMFRGSEEWIGPDGWGARNANGKGRFIKVFLNIAFVFTHRYLQHNPFQLYFLSSDSGKGEIPSRR